MKKMYFLFWVLLFVFSCGKDKLVGAWILSKQEQIPQGFILKPDGSASAINTSLVNYTSWSHKNGILTLNSECQNNDQTIKISEQFTIQKLDEHTLELRLKDSVFTYTRKNSK